MIATIPPLWRDADAYVQTTENPLIATFWGYAPAYCYVAKVPLFVGERFERWRENAPAAARESSQPRLTDSGIWLLIVGQHLALCGAAFYFIIAVSYFFWVRLALAMAWASNSLFYTFAHCVGSETLGLILIVLLVGKGLRLIQSRGEPRWKGWYVYAVILCLCFLSRSLNLGLISLLPAAFLLSLMLNRAAARCASSVPQRLWLRRLGARDLRYALIAIAIGFASLAMASYATHGVARKTRFHPHSRIGFTFLWRLQFLEDLSPDSRVALMRRMAARARSPRVRQLIELREQMLAERADMSSGPYMQRAIELYGGNFHWEELDRGLNQMALTFLLPPSLEILNAAREDLVTVLKSPSTVVSYYLFATTSYYFGHQEEMSQCAGLVTFRNSHADQIALLPSQHLYLHLWQGLSYLTVFIAWLVLLLVFAVMARRRRTNMRAIAAFGIALTAVGFLVFASACLVHNLEARFAVTMWQLLLLSLFLFAGKTVDLFARPA
ncbi:MAG: hypothetical protein DLM73_00850 [Chthoniobacterales bacterium]|nr:MAG: hypothetical protein DLM73_00850 [Chthoniobacterales bacterium]